MNKKLILTALAAILFCGSSMAHVVVDETNFPDNGFRHWIKNNIASSSDDVLTDDELAQVKSLDISESKDWIPIRDIKGIEFFTELEQLYIENYKFGATIIEVTEIDVSKNKKLKSLSWYLGQTTIYGTASKLTSLNVAGLSSLETLTIKGSAVPVIDLTGCSGLKNLSIYNGETSSLVMNDCRNLQLIYCPGNKLTKLDLSNCHDLTSLNCSSNSLTTLSLNSCSKIDFLNCSQNNLKSLNLDSCSLLNWLDCNHNPLLSLSLNGCNQIDTLNCSYSHLTSLDLSNLGRLRSVNCSHTDLEELICDPLGNLDYIDFSWCTKLSQTQLQFPSFPKGIKSIVCSGTQFVTNANVSQYDSLTTLIADSCELTSFDATICPNVTKLHLVNNHLTSLDLTVLKGNLEDKDLALNQTVTLDAVKLTGDQSDKWQINMPLNFNGDKVVDYTGGPLSGLVREVQVSQKQIIDADGNTRTAFITNRITKIYLSSSSSSVSYVYAPFWYWYNCSSKSSSVAKKNKDKYCMSVDVYGKETSSINEVDMNKAVSAVSYYDLTGRCSTQPFDGVNIVVTHYTDGTTTTTKTLR